MEWIGHRLPGPPFVPHSSIGILDCTIILLHILNSYRIFRSHKPLCERAGYKNDRYIIYTRAGVVNWVLRRCLWTPIPTYPSQHGKWSRLMGIVVPEHLANTQPMTTVLEGRTRCSGQPGKLEGGSRKIGCRLLGEMRSYTGGWGSAFIFIYLVLDF